MSFLLPSIPGISSDKDTKKEASLDDILPKTQQRVDLIVLVAICSENMRDGFKACFVNQFTNTHGTKASEFWHEPRDKPQISETDSTNTNILDVQWLRDRDLSSAEMRSLKAAGLEHYNSWRSNVLRRLGEALKVKSDIVRTAKLDYQSNEVSAKRSEQDKEFYAWADGEDKASSIRSELGTGSTGMSLPYPVVALPLTIAELDEKTRALVLGAVLFLLLSLETYPAQSRSLMSYLCEALKLPYDVLASVETSTALTLLQTVQKSGIDAEDARKKQEDSGFLSRKIKIGLATVAGAVVIGVTGGLAAPLMLGVAGTIMGGVGLGGLATLLGATIVNPITIGALFGALGARMTGNAMDAYSKEIEDFKFIPLERHSGVGKENDSAEVPAHKLRVAIGIAGWVTRSEDVIKPWQVLSPLSVEPFALRYEEKALINLGTTLEQVLKSTAFGIVRGKAIGLLLPSLAAAMAPLGLLKWGQILDNPFTIAMERSDKAGKVLAHALIDKAQGERPVTLIGFSLGARVVYACLEELATQKAFGLVEDAILIGSPVPTSEITWRKMRAVVSGRLVNVYTTKDMLLGYLYRARNIQLGVAGLQEITTVPGVQNKDVTHIVNGHNQYKLAIGKILQEVQLADLDQTQVEQEEVELKKEEMKEKQIYEQAKEKGQLKDVEDADGELKMVEDNNRTEKIESGRENSDTYHGNEEIASQVQKHQDNSQPQHQYEIENGEDDIHQRIEMLDIEPEPIK